MLEIERHSDWVEVLSGLDKDDVSLLKGVDLVALMATARRHLRTTTICVVVCLCAGLLFGLLSQVKFTAQTALLIGNRQPPTVQDITAQPNADIRRWLTTEIEVIKSERVHARRHPAPRAYEGSGVQRNGTTLATVENSIHSFWR